MLIPFPNFDMLLQMSCGSNQCLASRLRIVIIFPHRFLSYKNVPCFKEPVIKPDYRLQKSPENCVLVFAINPNAGVHECCWRLLMNISYLLNHQKPQRSAIKHSLYTVILAELLDFFWESLTASKSEISVLVSWN